MPSTVYFRNLVRENPLTPSIHQFPYGVAFFSAGRWWYSGVAYGGAALAVPIEQQDIGALKEWIATLFHDRAPVESDYKPGTAYKRISLPFNIAGNLSQAMDMKSMTQSFVALKLLLTKMQDVFETIEPAQKNLESYGHKVRELLLLSAMEVEASWTAILKANGYAKLRMTTADYVKLRAPMLLDSFSLTLRSYTDFPGFFPFKGWSAQSPTRSLDWYDAYNRTKHNREEHLDAATLQRAVHAVGAVAVMFAAQYSYSFDLQDERRNLVRNIFTFNRDQRIYPPSCYIPNAEGGTKAWEWELVNYPFPP